MSPSVFSSSSLAQEASLRFTPASDTHSPVSYSLHSPGLALASRSSSPSLFLAFLGPLVSFPCSLSSSIPSVALPPRHSHPHARIHSHAHSVPVTSTSFSAVSSMTTNSMTLSGALLLPMSNSGKTNGGCRPSPRQNGGNPSSCLSERDGRVWRRVRKRTGDRRRPPRQAAMVARERGERGPRPI